MRETNLRSVDLNLLVVLRALLAERHVTQAAAVVGLSQPAMSRALSRLRALFHDALLVRSPTGLLPTPRALALMPRIEALLRDVQGLVADGPFDSAGLTGRLALSATDHQTLLLLPSLMRRLSREAPKLDVHVVPFSPAALGRMLRGEVEFSFGVAESELPAGLCAEPLYRDTFVTLLRQDHAALATWSLEGFLALDHVLVTVLDDGSGAVDAELAKQGRERRIALRIPHFYSAINIVAETELVTIPRSIALRYADRHGLVMLEPPVSLAPFTVIAIWPALLNDDAGSRWLRQVVAEEVRQLEGTLPVRPASGEGRRFQKAERLLDGAPAHQVAT